MPRLAGKVAFITGAGTGIGRATAKAMAAEGAKIVIAELNKAAGEQTAQIVAQAGGDCIAVPTDVTSEDSVKAAIAAAMNHYGALHVLHNNAGGSTNVDNTVVDAPIEFAASKVRVNAIAPSATMTARVRALVAGNAGLAKLADAHLIGLIEPEDIANMAVFLASDESRMVTGQVYPVDSGVTIS